MYYHYYYHYHLLNGSLIPSQLFPTKARVIHFKYVRLCHSSFLNTSWLPTALSHASCMLSPCNFSDPVPSTGSSDFSSQDFLLIFKQIDYDIASSHLHLLFFGWKIFPIHTHMASSLTLRSLFKSQFIREVFADYLDTQHTLTTINSSIL